MRYWIIDVIIALIGLAMIIAPIYIVYHFVIKYW